MQYAALFRGLNVGGKHIVKMQELRALLENLGLQDVKTYIQSGNAVFASERDENALPDLISAAFFAHFGFTCGLCIRTAGELRRITAHPPFSPEEIASAQAAEPGAEHFYVFFLDGPPEPAKLEAARDCAKEDIVRSGEREIFLLCRRSIRKSPAAACLAKAFPGASVRNWKTVSKIAGLFD